MTAEKSQISNLKSSSAIRDAAMLRYVTQESWALQETVADRFLEILTRHADGVKLTSEQIAAAIGSDDSEDRDPEPAYRESGSTAVVSVEGVIAKHAAMVNGISQPEGSSCERIMADLQKARSNPRIQTVVIKLDTPGGTVAGISDAADMIYAMRSEKLMVAFADDMAASGGAWLASQCQEFFCNKAALVGSIGVIMVAVDRSAQADASGVKYHVIKSGAFKGTAGAPVKFSAEDFQEMQSRVDSLHAVFVGEVARGRGMDAQAVAAFADGRCFTGQQAVDAGLCDGVCSFEELMQSINAGTDRPSRSQGNRGAGTGVQTTQGDASMAKETTAAAGPQTTPDAAAQAQQAEALKNAQASGAKAERERIAAINAALPGEMFAAARNEAVEKGLDVTAAKALAFEAAVPALKAAGEKAAAAETKVAEAKAENDRLRALALAAGVKDPLPAGKDPEAAGGENAQGGASAGYEARVSQLVKGGMKDSEARLKAGGEFPEEHIAWRKEQDAKRRRK
jgi:signal peptide peptidase SppA